MIFATSKIEVEKDNKKYHKRCCQQIAKYVLDVSI
jgi:hypothetical protein